VPTVETTFLSQLPVDRQLRRGGQLPELSWLSPSVILADEPTVTCIQNLTAADVMRLLRRI